MFDVKGRSFQPKAINLCYKFPEIKKQRNLSDLVLHDIVTGQVRNVKDAVPSSHKLSLCHCVIYTYVLYMLPVVLRSVVAALLPVPEK